MLALPDSGGNSQCLSGLNASGSAVHPCVNALAQTAHGYLWLGTADKALAERGAQGPHCLPFIGDVPLVFLPLRLITVKLRSSLRG